jgi:hypothetical protein
VAQIERNDAHDRKKHQRRKGHQLIRVHYQAYDYEVQPQQPGCKSKHHQYQALVRLNELGYARWPNTHELCCAVKDGKKDKSEDEAEACHPEQPFHSVEYK